MNGIVFIIKDSIKGVLREWKINLMFVSVLFGAVVLAVYCIGSIRFLKEDLKQARYQGIESTVEVSFTGSLLDRSVIRSAMSETQGKKMSVSSIQKQYLPALNGRSWFVLGIDEDYKRYRHIEVGKGVFPVFSDRSRECLIGEQCALENELSVGDTVKINGIDLKIAGITRQRRYKSYIIVPYGRVQEMGFIEPIQQIILITGKDVQPDKVQGFMADSADGELVYCESALELYRQSESVIRRWIWLRAAAGTTGMVFAAFNIFSVCFGKIQERRKEYLTKKILGLTEGGVFLAFFSENFIIVMLSCTLGWGAFVPLARLLGIKSVVLSDVRTAAGIFVLGTVFSLIYSYVLQLYLRKCTAVEILQESE